MSIHDGLSHISRFMHESGFERSVEEAVEISDIVCDIVLEKSQELLQMMCNNK